MRLFFAILYTVSILSCRAPKSISNAESDSTTHTAISSTVAEIVKDSLIYIPADSAWLHALLECDSNGKVLLKKILGYEAGRQAAIPAVSIENNRLDVKNRVDSQAIYIAWKERHSSKDSVTVVTKTKTVTITKPVRYNTWYDNFFIYTGKLALIILVLYAVYKKAGAKFNIITILKKWVA
ncbi:MAG TPA: hypothetical protein PKC39_14545 [Ferruginibacter sp.]|nr:hypothetical protein [Ferruginibacter sp.]HMP22175.1 hypothetical protein [Ferruginibacter sp.]